MSALVCLALLQPALSKAWPADPSINVPVCTASGTQQTPVMVPDGSGGAFIAWADYRNALSTGSDIYVQRLTPTGAVAAGWPNNGLLVCNAAGAQTSPAMVADGAGGVLLAWEDARGVAADIYATRVTGIGGFGPGWPVNGLLVGAGTGSANARDDLSPQLLADGTGGAFVLWKLVYGAGTDYDVYANHFTVGGTIVSGWPAQGLGVDVDVAIQEFATMCPDGAGGIFVAFEDNLSGNWNIRGAHLSSAGGFYQQNVDLEAYSGDQRYPVIASDGYGGFVLVFSDFTGTNVTMARFSSSMTAGFAASGVSGYSNARPIGLLPDDSGGWYVVVADADAFLLVDHTYNNGSPWTGWLPGKYTGGVISGIVGSWPPVVGDGAGGVIAIAPNDFDFTLVGSRYLASGAIAAGWNAKTPISTVGSLLFGSHHQQAVVRDGAGGAIATWIDGRAGNFDIYAQRVDRFGALGDAAPVMAGVRDVPNDQGGAVRVSWNASYLDAEPLRLIASYEVFRQAPASVALAALRAGSARLLAEGEATAADGARTYLVTRDGVTTTYWEQVASASAQALPGYSLVTSTTGDSVGGSNPRTLFMVKAVAGSGAYWYSAPDSGYSVDNLAPPAPAPFSGTFVSGTGAMLTWGPSTAPDFAYYRLYKGYSPGFMPGPGNLVAQTTLPSYTDPSGHDAIYKVSAVDVHGNESAFASTVPGGTTAVGNPDLPAMLELAPANPNPARVATLLRYGLPRAARVRLGIYDAAGREVRLLAAGTAAAGRYEVRWNGSDAAGHPAASGLFFVRLECEGQVLTRRLAWLR